PDWPAGDLGPSSPKVPNPVPSYEVVYLQLIEQEVSAAEDQPLREIALGGPDTSQRTRITQHIVRNSLTTPPTPPTCASAQSQLVTALTALGQSFNTTTMQLKSLTTLQASFGTSSTPDPCAPTTQTGYLGAENQLIRVQVSQVITNFTGPTITFPVL